METGLGVLHLFGKARKSLDREAVVTAVKAAEADECQVITASLLGHKADVAFMALAPDWRTLRTLQTALHRAGIDIVDSYVRSPRSANTPRECPNTCCSRGSTRSSRQRVCRRSASTR